MPRFDAIAHWRSAAFVVVALGAAGFLPLFGGPGYEHSLATGLIVPSATAIAIAWRAARRSGQGSPLVSITHGVVLGIVLAGLSLLTAFVHAARVGLCEFGGAVVYFALTAGAGSVMGGVWGAVVGETVAAFARRGRVTKPTRRDLLTVLLAVGGPLVSAAISVGRFVTSPMIFAYDPFVGYFSGTLYDTVIDAGTPMLTYRLGSLATVASVTLLASSFERRTDGSFGVARDAAARGRVVLGAVAALSSISLIAYGKELGHFTTAASIAETLGAAKHGARCDVFYPSTTREQEAWLLVKDCEEQLASVERRLGAPGPLRVRAFFFRDAEDKKRQMGAAHTYIAKPWREEVYLQLGGYPHPVLGHELAHVVAGSFGRGPFRIAGSLGGLLPNPGLIEGIAVAAAPEDDDLIGASWAHAMKDAGILPSMQRVFSLGFLFDASSKSYTVAGAFVAWVGERFGFDVVRAWYGGGELAALTHMEWRVLEAEFGAYLDTVPLSTEAAAFARAKFARPGVFGRKCPHVVDALRHRADACRDTQRYEEALRLYREAIAKDAFDFASRKEAASVERRHGDRDKGRAALVALATADDAVVPRTYRDRAEESLADAAFVEGDFDGAAARYEGLAARTVDEDAARTLEVKGLGAREPAAREAIRALLLGDDKHGPNTFLGGVELGRWSHADESGLAAYLIGRNLVGQGFYEAGANSLDVALSRPLATPRLTREALRQRIAAACAMDDQSALSQAKARIESAHDPFRGGAGGRRASTLAMIARCTR